MVEIITKFFSRFARKAPVEVAIVPKEMTIQDQIDFLQDAVNILRYEKSEITYATKDAQFLMPIIATLQRLNRANAHHIYCAACGTKLSNEHLIATVGEAINGSPVLQLEAYCPKCDCPAYFTFVKLEDMVNVNDVE